MGPEDMWQPPQVQLDSSRPLYEQFADLIRSDLARGRLLPGQRLPSIRELAAYFRVNPNTVMRAYQDLEREGFVVTFRGQGTFVATDPQGIDKSRRILARGALAQLDKVAQSVGMTVDELIALARRGDEK